MERSEAVGGGMTSSTSLFNKWWDRLSCVMSGLTESGWLRFSPTPIPLQTKLGGRFKPRSGGGCLLTSSALIYRKAVWFV